MPPALLTQQKPNPARPLPSKDEQGLNASGHIKPGHHGVLSLGSHVQLACLSLCLGGPSSFRKLGESGTAAAAKT